MKLLTNIDVTYNVGLTETTSGIIEGRILKKQFLENGDINVVYEYLHNGVEIQLDGFNVKASDVEMMYDVIKLGLPNPDDGFMNYIDTVFYEAMKIEMIRTFNDLTNISQIDLIID